MTGPRARGGERAGPAGGGERAGPAGADVADAELRAWLDGLGPYAPVPVAQMRAAGAERARTRARGPEMAAVRDLEAGGVPARAYVPDGSPAPLLVYLHGGGWTIGSIATHDLLCRCLASAAVTRVLSLEYRLAPEHPWPASVNDAVSALRWVASADGRAALGVPAPGPVAVGGDSAGGTMATLACLRLRDEAPTALPDVQALLYPNTDLTGAMPSMTEKATGWGLDVDQIRFFNAQWVPDPGHWGEPGVSPLHAADVSGLPRTLLITAEHDPLRDEGEAYADRLRDAGVTVTARREPGLVHGFAQLIDVSPACARATARFAVDLRAALGSGLGLRQPMPDLAAWVSGQQNVPGA